MKESDNNSSVIEGNDIEVSKDNVSHEDAVPGEKYSPKDDDFDDIKFNEPVTGDPVFINATLILRLKEELFNLKYIFPEFVDPLDSAMNKFENLQYDYFDKVSENKVKSTRVSIPGYPVSFDITDDQETIKSYGEAVENYKKVLASMEKYYKKEGTENQKKLVTVLKNNLDIITADDYLDNISEFPDYYLTSIDGAGRLPGIYFTNPENPEELELKPEKFDKYINDYNLLDQYISTQNFYMGTFKPVNEARTKDNVHLYNASFNYNSEYRKYLNKQKQYLKQNHLYANMNQNRIGSESTADDEGKDYKIRFGSDSSYTSQRIQSIDMELKLMNNGWPAADMVFFRALKEAQKQLAKDLRNKNIPSDLRKQYEEIQAAMKEPCERAFNSYVTSPAVRDKLLADLEPAIKKYNEVKLPIVYRDSVKNGYTGTDLPLVRSYYNTVSKPIKFLEAGTNPLIITKDQNGDNTLTGLSLEELQTNLEYMLKDLKKVDPKTVSSSGQFIEMKTSLTSLVNEVKAMNQRIAKHSDTDLSQIDKLPSYDQFLSKIVDDMQQTKQLTKAYLDYKKDQFRLNGQRRNKWIKQFREQPRIEMATNLYEKLGYITERADYILSANKFSNAHPGATKEEKQKHMEKVQADFNKVSANRYTELQNYRGDLTSNQRRANNDANIEHAKRADKTFKNNIMPEEKKAGRTIKF